MFAMFYSLLQSFKNRLQSFKNIGTEDKKMQKWKLQYASSLGF